MVSPFMMDLLIGQSKRPYAAAVPRTLHLMPFFAAICRLAYRIYFFS